MEPVSITPTVASTAITTHTQRRLGSLGRRLLRRLLRRLDVTGAESADGIVAVLLRRAEAP
jgi:hypothetical protein